MRWADLGSSDAAGSGRVMIWKAAIDNILNGTPSDQVFGHGFDGMLDLIYTSIGVRLHTHNDVFDMLLVGGLFGLLILALVFSGLVTQLQAHPKSPEFAVAVGILIVLCCQGFFTGQMFLPDVMAYYLLSITTVLSFETGGLGEARRFARAGRRT
jgi:O-antigen ligase